MMEGTADPNIRGPQKKGETLCRDWAKQVIEPIRAYEACHFLKSRFLTTGRV